MLQPFECYSRGVLYCIITLLEHTDLIDWVMYHLETTWKHFSFFNSTMSVLSLSQTEVSL